MMVNNFFFQNQVKSKGVTRETLDLFKPSQAFEFSAKASSPVLEKEPMARTSTQEPWSPTKISG